MCKHIWERSHRCGNLDMKENSLLPWLQADFQQNTSQTNLLAAKDACTEVRQKSTWLQSCVVTCSFHLDYVIVETNGKLTGIFCIFLSWKKSYPRSKKQYEKSLNCARSQNYRKKASRSLLTDGQGGSVVRVRARKAGGLRSRPIWKKRAPQMLVGWVRFPVGSDRRLEKRYCLSSLVLSVNGRVQGKVNARCWHWLATSAAFTAKVAAWPTAQVSGEWGSRPLQIKDYKASSIFFLSITIKKQWNQKYWTDKATRLLAWNTNWSTDIADLPSVTTAWWSSRTMTSAASARSPAGRGTDESRCRTRAQCGPRTARWCRFYCTTDKTWVLFSVKHPSRLKHGRAVQTHKRFWELLYYLVRFAPLVWFFLLTGGVKGRLDMIELLQTALRYEVLLRKVRCAAPSVMFERKHVQDKLPSNLLRAQRTSRSQAELRAQRMKNSEPGLSAVFSRQRKLLTTLLCSNAWSAVQ